MAKPEWGKKHLCPSCGIKFYDMRRSPVICPSCGTKVESESATARKGRGGSRAAQAPAAAAAVSESPAAEETPELEEIPAGDESVDPSETEGGEDEEEAYSDVIEDTSELGEESSFSSVVGEEEDDST